MTEFLSNPTAGAGVSFPGGGGGGLSNPLSDTEPATPATGLSIFSRKVANRRVLSWKAADGEVYQAQPFFARNRVAMCTPVLGSGTPSIFGFTHANYTTAPASMGTPASTNLATSLKSNRYATAATANGSSGWRESPGQWWRGNAAGRGGFFFCCRFFTGTAPGADGRVFIGMAAATTFSATTVPSAVLNTLYLGYTAGQTTFRVGHNDGSGSATETDLGANFPTNVTTAVYEVIFYCPPNSNSVFVRVERLDQTLPLAYDDAARANYIHEAEWTTDIPSNTTFLGLQFFVTNGATAAVHALNMISTYCEADT